MPGLRETLEAATPGPWEVWVDDLFVKVQGTPDGPHVCNAGRDSWPGTNEDARLIALAPEIAALCLDMGEALRWTDNSLSHVLAGKPHRAIAEVHANNDALLARLDQLGKEPA